MSVTTTQQRGRKLRRTPKLIASAAALSMLAVPLTQMQAASAAPAPNSGFSQPFAGTTQYQSFAPKEAKRGRQINKPMGRKTADRIARKLGLTKADVLTTEQYRQFISGGGVGGKVAPAKLVDQAVRLLINTTGTPLYTQVDGVRTPVVLGSYGLVIDRDGMLQSPANTAMATRQVNWVLAPDVVCRFPGIQPPPGIPDGVPCGYMGKWMRDNGARNTLETLYSSAYPGEVVYGNRSQETSGVAQLVSNTKLDVTTTVGMSMVPSIWLVNFMLIYVLNPKKAAKMPYHWEPIPTEVVDAINASPTGQVPYVDYMDYFRKTR